MKQELLEEVIELLKTLKVDAKLGIKGYWNPIERNDEGWDAQIWLINKTLPKLKKLRNDTRNK